MNGKTLEEMDQFKYLGSTQTKDRTSIKEVKIRLARAHSAMTRLEILSMEKQIRQFSYNDRTRQAACLVITVLWM